MKAIAGHQYMQVLNGVAHWLFTETDLPEWNENQMTTVDLTALGIPVPTIGWVWNATTSTFTDPLTLADYQSDQIATLYAACANAIVSGFQSSALGAAYTYPSQPNDQSNLVGAVTDSMNPNNTSTWSCNFWCADSSGVWAMRPHTASQIQQVLADGVALRESYSSKLDSLVSQVQAATDAPTVQAIVW